LVFGFLALGLGAVGVHSSLDEVNLGLGFHLVNRSKAHIYSYFFFSSPFFRALLFLSLFGLSFVSLVLFSSFFFFHFISSSSQHGEAEDVREKLLELLQRKEKLLELLQRKTER
jgi:hypothetical protein